MTLVRKPESSVYAYVGYRSCGHPALLLVDDGTDQKWLGREMARGIKDGYHFERVSLARARAIGVVYCYCVPVRGATRSLGR